MKKQLIIAFAISVLFLSACSSLVGTSTSSNSPVAHSIVPIAIVSMKSVCLALQERQSQFSQQYLKQMFSAAQTQGNSQQAGEAEKTLIRLHQFIVQVQAQTKTC